MSELDDSVVNLKEDMERCRRQEDRMATQEEHYGILKMLDLLALEFWGIPGLDCYTVDVHTNNATFVFSEVSRKDKSMCEPVIWSVTSMSIYDPATRRWSNTREDRHRLLTRNRVEALKKQAFGAIEIARKYKVGVME